MALLICPNTHELCRIDQPAILDSALFLHGPRCQAAYVNMSNHVLLNAPERRQHVTFPEPAEKKRHHLCWSKLFLSCRRHGLRTPVQWQGAHHSRGAQLAERKPKIERSPKRSCNFSLLAFLLGTFPSFGRIGSVSCFTVALNSLFPCWFSRESITAHVRIHVFLFPGDFEHDASGKVSNRFPKRSCSNRLQAWRRFLGVIRNCLEPSGLEHRFRQPRKPKLTGPV